MPSASLRLLTVVVAAASLLVAGLVGPAAGTPASDAPATVVRELRGLAAQRPGARVSKQVSTAIPFSMIGFEVPAGAALEFRTSADGKTWTDWTPTEVVSDEGPDPQSVEGRNATPRMTMPIWVGEAAAVQTRLEGGQKAVPANAAVHLIDSSGLGRSWGTRVLDRLGAAWRGTPTAAHAGTTRPDIVTRSGWGANESLRRGAPSYASGIRAGFVHHTVNDNGYSRAQADDLVRGIYSYHVQSNGWSDIGYNFLVDRFGTIYEGRYGGITKAVIGAHAGGFNTETFGVSLIGSFDNTTPSSDMLTGVRSLLAWKYDLHHTSVLGKTSYTTYGSTRYSSGTTVDIQRLSGHRDASTTSCPGDRTYELLPTLRRQVADLQGPVLLSPSVSPATIEVIDGQSVSGPAAFRASLRPAGEWTLEIRDQAGTIVHTVDDHISTDSIAYDWHPQGMSPGTYTYSLDSPDRRAARGVLTLQSPHIEGSASPRRTTFAPDGTLKPVTFSGALYRGANWKLRIFDPTGVRVRRFTGQGESFTRVWDTPVSSPGLYSWDLSADAGTPVAGTVRVHADFVDRVGSRTDVAGAAAGISRRTFPLGGSATRAVLSPLGLPGHALVAGPVAGTAGPVLYAGASTMPAETLSELERAVAPGGTVYVMGDTISNAVLSRVDVTRRGRWIVRRIPGASGPAVAAAAAPVVTAGTGATSVILAGNTGDTAWRQSVAAGAYATRAGIPILLTNRSRLSAPAAQELSKPHVRHVRVVGNRDVVARAVIEEVARLKQVTRTSGPTSAATGVAVATRLFGRTQASAGDRWMFANTARDAGWARALAAAPLSAATNAPVLVSGRATVPDATASYLDGLGYGAQLLGYGTVLGDTQHVDGPTRTTLARRLQ